MSDPSKKPLIPDRVMMIGEQAVPPEAIENLPDDRLQIFLREPDTAKWPGDMHDLVKYLSEEERVGYAVAKALAGYDGILKEPLDQWAEAAWKDLAGERGSADESTHVILRAMVKHLEELLLQCLGRL